MLTCLVWLFVALAMRPIRDADGSYSSQPYGWTTSSENQALDLLFQMRDIRQKERRGRGKLEPLVIVEIDDATLQAVGIRAQNWRRSDYAHLIDKASVGGATVIGLDVLLAGESGLTEEQKKDDTLLIDSMTRAGNVVLIEKSASGGTQAIKPAAMFTDAAWAVGFADLPLDSDGFVRSSALRLFSEKENDWQLSFAARLVEGHRFTQIYERKLQELKQRGLSEDQAQKEATEFAQREAIFKQLQDGSLLGAGRALPLRPDGFMQLDYRSRPRAFETISAIQLLTDKVSAPPDIFRNRIVLIAQTSIASGDYFSTPYYEPSLLTRLLDPSASTAPVRTSGVEIHSTAIATMLNGELLVRPRYVWQIVFVLLPLMLAAFAVFHLRAWQALLLIILIAVGALIVSSWVFNSRAVVLPLASSWLGLVLIAPAGLAMHFARERSFRTVSEKDRAQMMEIFSRCVSPDVAATLWKQRGNLTLESERRIVTLIFTDIRNFTTLCEVADSLKVVEWLKEYFTRMNQIVTSHGGHISKFIGDGLMIVFGAPLSRGHQVEARAAVDCGLAMLNEVKNINEDWRGTGRPEIAIGVGIHTGEATCGVVGSLQRLEYTIIGDTVNLTARLESKTKEVGLPLLLSAATAELLDGTHTLRNLGDVDVKGKNIKTTVFTIEDNVESRAD